MILIVWSFTLEYRIFKLSSTMNLILTARVYKLRLAEVKFLSCCVIKIYKFLTFDINKNNFIWNQNELTYNCRGTLKDYE